jgi:hypothetical protein
VKAAGMEPYFVHNLKAGSLKKQEDGNVSDCCEIQRAQIENKIEKLTEGRRENILC